MPLVFPSPDNRKEPMPVVIIPDSPKPTNYQPLGYGVRNEILRHMGYSSYADYLDSDLWEGIRKKVLSRDKGKCRLCGKSANSVHHAGYTLENLQGNTNHLLFSLCQKCHYKLEFDTQDPERKLCVDDVLNKTKYYLTDDAIEHKQNGVRISKPWIGLAYKRYHLDKTGKVKKPKYIR